MGVSTDAILFWGFFLTEDEEGEDDEMPWLDEEYEWDTFYAKQLGIEEPTVPYNRDDEEVVEIYHAYWRSNREAAKASGCDIAYHCSGDYPLYYVTVEESRIRASRGYPEEITDLCAAPEWHDRLQRFCKVMDIPWQEPKWWLVSLWN